VLLSVVLLVVTVWTNLVSNNTAGIIAAPIAVQVATELGASPEPFILAVLFGANMSFATPLGHQTNLLVLSAGGYRFRDFLRAGIPLTVLMWLGLSLLLAATYDL
jgi:di/tricarboxylate transporter